MFSSVITPRYPSSKISTYLDYKIRPVIENIIIVSQEVRVVLDRLLSVDEIRSWWELELNAEVRFDRGLVRYGSNSGGFAFLTSVTLLSFGFCCLLRSLLKRS
jgi:hypothetical protein